MTTLDPRSITCPNCNAQPGEPCTQPTDTTRKAVAWYHLARERDDVPSPDAR